MFFSEAATGITTWTRRRRRRSRAKNDQPITSQIADKTTSARSAKLNPPSTVLNEELTDEQLTEDGVWSKS